MRYYKDIAFKENNMRLKLLSRFRLLIVSYFANSTLNMVTGEYTEKEQALEAREEITLMLQEAYEVIRLAGIKTYSASNSSLSAYKHGKSIDLILNIFNLGRNEIPPSVAIEYIERAVDIYNANRLPSFVRTVNPFFWIKRFMRYITGRS